MGELIRRSARPKAFVQATSPFLMQDTTAPGTLLLAKSAGIRSFSASAKESSEPTSAVPPEASLRGDKKARLEIAYRVCDASQILVHNKSALRFFRGRKQKVSLSKTWLTNDDGIIVCAKNLCEIIGPTNRSNINQRSASYWKQRK